MSDDQFSIDNLMDNPFDANDLGFDDDSNVSDDALAIPKAPQNPNLGTMKAQMPTISSVTPQMTNQANQKSASLWDSYSDKGKQLGQFRRNREPIEGIRQLYVSSLYINENPDTQSNDPYVVSVRFNFRQDEDLQKARPLKGSYVTSIPNAPFPHNQQISLREFHQLLQVNNMKMPSNDELQQHATNHRPLYSSRNNLACQARVFYGDINKRDKFGHPIDYVNPESIAAPIRPFDYTQMKKNDSARYLAHSHKDINQQPKYDSNQVRSGVRNGAYVSKPNHDAVNGQAFNTQFQSPNSTPQAPAAAPVAPTMMGPSQFRSPLAPKAPAIPQTNFQQSLDNTISHVQQQSKTTTRVKHRDHSAQNDLSR